MFNSCHSLKARKFTGKVWTCLQLCVCKPPALAEALLEPQSCCGAESKFPQHPQPKAVFGKYLTCNNRISLQTTYGCRFVFLIEWVEEIHWIFNVVLVQCKLHAEEKAREAMSAHCASSWGHALSTEEQNPSAPALSKWTLFCFWKKRSPCSLLGGNSGTWTPACLLTGMAPKGQISGTSLCYRFLLACSAFLPALHMSHSINFH